MKMSKVLLFFIISFILLGVTSCDLAFLFATEEDYVKDFTVPIYGTPSEIMEIIHYSINYKGESEDYVQSPKETYRRGTGDCEDFAVYFAFIIKQNFGVEPEFIRTVNSKGGHIVVLCNGVIYDPTNNYEFDWDMYENYYYITNRWDYQYFVGSRATDGWMK